MKKLVVLLLMITLGIGCVACSKKNPTDTQNTSGVNSEMNQPTEQDTQKPATPSVQVTDSLEILTKVWNSYGEEEKFYAAGGHPDAYVEGKPASYNLSKAEDLERTFCIPQESIQLVDDAATLQHSMNINNFSAAAYHLKSASDMQKVVDSIKDMTLNNQWLCGFPEKLIVVSVGDEYLVSAYGNGELITNFENKLSAVYGNAVKVMVKEDL